MHLEFGFTAAPLSTTLPATNSTVDCLVYGVSGSMYVPFNLPSLPFMFLSLRFASMLMFCSYPFPFSCLPVFFIILYWKSKKNMHLEFGFRVSPLPIALPAINSTQCISVHCLARDVSDSSVIFLSTCLHCLSFSFLFVLLACCLPASSTFPFFLSTSFLHHPLLTNQRKHALRIWIHCFPLINCTACHKLYSVHCLAHDMSGSSYLPFNLPSLSFMFLSLRFAGMLSYSTFPFSCLPVSFIIFFGQSKKTCT